MSALPLKATLDAYFRTSATGQEQTLIRECLPQFEFTSHHWHACAANLGRGHPASTLIRTGHEPARSPHFDALTDRLCKTQVCLGVQVREQADQRNICAARSGILRYSIERCKHP